MILVDIDTQIDFLLSAGALYVSGAERLIPVFARIFEHAEQRGIPVISSVDAHTENDPEFNDWPPHCVAGTLGQQKIAATLLKQRATISSRSEARWPRDVQQMIVEKQTLDAFSNPNFSGILQQCPTQPSDAEYVVFGVATDYCVRCAVDGLLNAGKQVRVLTDAIRAIDAVQSEKLLASWAARGAALTTTDTLWR